MFALITPQQFLDAEGTGEWRLVDGVAHLAYRSDSFAESARFALAVAEHADAVDHHPEIDLRYGSIAFRLISFDVGQLTDRDIRLAQRISEIARGFDVARDDGGRAG